MHTNSISKLLNLKGIKVQKIIHTDSNVQIQITTKAIPVRCPCCGQTTAKIHDYRNQIIKDLPLLKKHTILVLRKRRYRCACGKQFYEHYDFLPKYHRMTNRLCAHICYEMSKCIPVSTVAQDLDLSANTINRVFDHVQYPSLQVLPEVLAIDEFRGNAETDKYQCILVDPVNRVVLDILPDRKQLTLINFFKGIPRKQRLKVKFFVCDMWKQFADIAYTFLPNAVVIVDKYHFIRQVSWALENVRKRVQKTMLPSLRRYYKRSRSLMLKRSHTLTTQEKESLDLMLLYNDDLRQAYRLKEEFYKLCKLEDYSEISKSFSDWIMYAESMRIPEFKSCIRAFRNWSKEILSAFKYGYTNGPTEGFNNKIKVLKRVSYGLKNFNRFRNRILHICS